MKKIFLLILGLAIIGGGIYFGSNLKPKPDETKTVGQPENAIQPTTPSDSGTGDLTVPELEDFDQEVQDLDKSINQL